MIETITQAAKLADGFASADENLAIFYVWPAKPTTPQWWLDALAAQLVRQVDAMPGCRIRIRGDQVIVIDAETSSHLGVAYGMDRTANIITAVTLSGVLE